MVSSYFCIVYCDVKKALMSKLIENVYVARNPTLLDEKVKDFEDKCCRRERSVGSAS